MGIFRRKAKKQIQLVGIKGFVSRIRLQDQNFPLIEMKFTVEEDDQNNLVEVIVMMNMYEATAVANKLANSVAIANDHYSPRATPRIPWE